MESKNNNGTSISFEVPVTLPGDLDVLPPNAIVYAVFGASIIKLSIDAAGAIAHLCGSYGTTFKLKVEMPASYGRKDDVELTLSLGFNSVKIAVEASSADMLHGIYKIINRKNLN